LVLLITVIVLSVVVILLIIDRWSSRRSGPSRIPTANVMRHHSPARRPSTAVVADPATPLPQSSAVAEIEINDDFRRALDLIAERRQSAFITGKAGTGKSTLLRIFCDAAVGKVVILAPTGLAAINVHGQTIHSFFKTPPRLVDPLQIKVSRNPEIFRRIETIVIDEVSMVRADLMDGIDATLRINRGRPNTPFGGVQVVSFGDLFQLPPVVKEAELKQFFATRYGSPYFFNAAALRSAAMPLVELEKVYRQTDAEFLNLLNQIRDNRLEHTVGRVEHASA